MLPVVNFSLDRELFVDATRSVSVVLGEKDNKSVRILVFSIMKLNCWCHKNCVEGVEEADEGGEAGGAEEQEEESAQGEERRQGGRRGFIRRDRLGGLL